MKRNKNKTYGTREVYKMSYIDTAEQNLDVIIG